MTMMLPVPRHLVEKAGQGWTQPDKLVTSGPFLLADWQPGQTMSLVYNPRYHGLRQGNLRAITLRFGGTPAAALQQYEAGQLDVLPLADLPTSERNLVRRRYMEGYLLAPRLATIFLRLDLSRSPFTDPRLRRALAHAIDRVKLAGEALHGYDFPASGMLPAGMPGYAPDSGLPFDPEQARQLLAAAGYPQGRGFPAIPAWAWPGIAPVCAELSRQWQEQLGIDVQWHYVEWPEFTQIGSKGYPDLFLYGLVVAYPDPDDLLRLQYGGALICWQHDEYARLIAEAGRIQDQQQRLHLYRQADRLLCYEAPVIPLLHERLHLLVKPWVRAVLHQLGLGDWLARLPQGLDTPIHSGALSAVAPPLLALARVFSKDPGRIILDEASSRLDPATEALLDRALNVLLRGRTAIIIAHRLPPSNAPTRL